MFKDKIMFKNKFCYRNKFKKLFVFFLFIVSVFPFSCFRVNL